MTEQQHPITPPPEPEATITEPRGCPTPGACSCPTAPYAPPELIRALELAEAALADIGDAEREPGDDLAWAENRAAQDLPRIRAALARWGRPSIKPVSLSERLPGPEDCDAEGRCWYFFMDSVIGGCGWQMFNEEENQQLEASHFWLPHYALPVPTLCDEENK